MKPVKQSELFNTITIALGHGVDESILQTTCFAVQKAQRSLSILLVEDNPVNQKVAAAMLNKRGHRVVIASNGREALEVQNKANFDLILMDIQMPEMDGLQATEAIRDKEKDSGGRRIPIVAMTAHAVAGFQEMCFAAGMDGYISKPIQPNVLYQALDEAVGRTSSLVPSG